MCNPSLDCIYFYSTIFSEYMLMFLFQNTDPARCVQGELPNEDVTACIGIYYFQIQIFIYILIFE